ncbi:MAG: non-canonical purine NTP pyrophosphatase [archaeon]
MTRITLITSNPNKVKEFSQVLEPDIGVDHVELEYPELRSDDPEEIVRLAASQLADRMGKPVVAEDSGLFIDALQGFPGTCTKYVFQRIGNDGLLKVMENVDAEKRRCFYKSAVGYCEPGGKAVSFLGVEEGTIAESARGDQGWGQDPIFIPAGDSKTYGELRKDGDVNIFRRKAVEKLREFLLDREARET